MSSDRIVTAKKPRPRGFAPWSPNPASQGIIADIRRVLMDYSTYLPLTVRQVFYRLVATTGYGKTEREYKNLCEKINRGKRAGMLNWDDFRDDGITATNPPGYESQQSIEDTVEWLLRQGINKQVWQPVQQIVLCEAAGMVPQLKRVSDDFGVAVMSSSGFDSSTGRYQLAEKVVAHCHNGKEVIVQHIGDFDPSGVHVYQSLCDDVSEFVADMGGDVTFRRVAITPDQIALHQLPEAPAKASDNRIFTGSGTVQCEALPPDALASILRFALDQHFDRAIDDDGEDESQRIMAEVLAMYSGVES